MPIHGTGAWSIIRDGFFKRFADKPLQIKRIAAIDGKVRQSPGCAETLGKPCFFQIRFMDTHDMIEHRITHQVFFPFLPDDDDVVGIEVEAHFGREIGGKIGGRLESHRLSFSR